MKAVNYIKVYNLQNYDTDIRVLIISIRVKQIVILNHTNLISMCYMEFYLFVTSLFQVSCNTRAFMSKVLSVSYIRMILNIA